MKNYKKYLSIYNFDILPLALGDILTWLAHQKLNALSKKCDEIEIRIIVTTFYKGNLINDIKEVGYWDVHLKELIKVFNFEKIVSDVKIYNNIEKIINNNYENYDDEITRIKNLLDKKIPLSIYYEYIREYQKYKKFNNYYYIKNKKIIFESKILLQNYVNKILLKYNIENYIVCQPRFRIIDKDLPVSDFSRDSNFINWYEFFEKYQYKKIVFIIIGRLNSIPKEFKKFKNIFFSRDIELEIEHEICLLLSSYAFIGASSGFAVAASFSLKPYFIFNVKKSGFDNFFISLDDNKLVYANDYQYVFKSEIEKNNILLKKLFDNIENTHYNNINYNNIHINETGNNYIIKLLRNNIIEITRSRKKNKLLLLLKLVIKVNKIFGEKISLNKINIIKIYILFNLIVSCYQLDNFLYGILNKLEIIKRYYYMKKLNQLILSKLNKLKLSFNGKKN